MVTCCGPTMRPDTGGLVWRVRVAFGALEMRRVVGHEAAALRAKTLLRPDFQAHEQVGLPSDRRKAVQPSPPSARSDLGRMHAYP